MVRADLEDAKVTRRGPSEAELKKVARIYREAIDGRPVDAVELHGDYSRRTAIRRIRQARDKGFLPETTRGKKNA